MPLRVLSAPQWIKLGGRFPQSSPNKYPASEDTITFPCTLLNYQSLLPCNLFKKQFPTLRSGHSRTIEIRLNALHPKCLSWDNAILTITLRVHFPLMFPAAFRIEKGTEIFQHKRDSLSPIKSFLARPSPHATLSIPNLRRRSERETLPTSLSTSFVTYTEPRWLWLRMLNLNMCFKEMFRMFVWAIAEDLYPTPTRHFIDLRNEGYEENVALVLFISWSCLSCEARFMKNLSLLFLGRFIRVVVCQSCTFPLFIIPDWTR
jgi:hypothetical protein